MGILTWRCLLCGKTDLTDLCECKTPNDFRFTYDMFAERQVSAVLNCSGCRLLGGKCKGRKYEALVPERITSKDGFITIMFERKIGESDNFFCHDYNMFKGFPILNWVEKKYCKIIVEEKDKERIIDYLNRGLKIQLIKYYREITNSGLREAKEWSDNLIPTTNTKILYPSFVNYIDLGKDSNRVEVCDMYKPNSSDTNSKIVDLNSDLKVAQIDIRDLKEIIKDRGNLIKGLKEDLNNLESEKDNLEGEFENKISNLIDTKNKAIKFLKDSYWNLVNNIEKYLGEEDVE